MSKKPEQKATTPGEIGRVDLKDETGTTGVKFHSADAIKTADALHDLMHDLIDKSSAAMGEAAYQRIKSVSQTKDEMRSIRRRIKVDEDKAFIDGFKAATNLMAAYFITKVQTLAKGALAGTEKPDLNNPHILHAAFVGGCEAAADFMGALHTAGRASHMDPSWMKTGADLLNATAHIYLMPLAEKYEAELNATNGGSSKPN